MCNECYVSRTYGDVRKYKKAGNLSFNIKYEVYHCLDSAACKFADGCEMWYLNGILHRDNGPAIIDGLYSCYYKHGKLHREDGPAIIWSEDCVEWYFEGIKISCNSLEEFQRKIKLQVFL